MKSSLIELLYSKFKYLVEVCWSGQNKADILYPHCVEDLVDILGQARENQTQELVDEYWVNSYRQSFGKSEPGLENPCYGID